mgnify:CR=1 FL=1|tara:strand:- start:1089 stop:1334 length:246 start_codon:yes stop_codon:yes gene_type:complete
MNLFNNQQQSPFEKGLIRLAIYELPGTILVVLGLYGRYWAEGDAFLPFLNDQQIVNYMLTAGIVIWLYCWTEFIKLVRNKP